MLHWGFICHSLSLWNILDSCTYYVFIPTAVWPWVTLPDTRLSPQTGLKVMSQMDWWVERWQHAKCIYFFIILNFVPYIWPPVTSLMFNLFNLHVNSQKNNHCLHLCHCPATNIWKIQVWHQSHTHCCNNSHLSCPELEYPTFNYFCH